MTGLRINDSVRWHDSWSAEIGRRLQVLDSSNDLLIFDPRYGRDEILEIIKEAPTDLYQLIDLEEAPETDCDFMADSGRCYRKLH